MGLGPGSKLSATGRNLLLVRQNLNSRYRVYPRDTTAPLIVTPGVMVNTWGAWTVAIPVDTVGMEYRVVGFAPEFVNNVGNPERVLMFQFAKSAAPTNPDILGEVRFRVDSFAWIVTVGPMYLLQMNYLLVNEGVWVRAMSDIGATAALAYSLTISRHYRLTGELLEVGVDWPWP